MPDTETNTIFFCIKKLTWNLCLTVSPTLLWPSSLLVMMIGRIYANYCHVTPIHRSGNKNLPNNYRPISLTSIPCKMLEHIVLNYLNKTLDVVLHNRQHGFRKGLSCDTQLCSTYHDLAKAHNESLTTHAVVLDFKKGFDKVPHSPPPSRETTADSSD